MIDQAKSPRPHQELAIEKATAHYQTQERGQLLMACGTGKTLTALWIAEALHAQNVIVALPSLQLQAQAVETWLVEARRFHRDMLVVGSDRSIWKQFRVATTTDPAVITAFLLKKGPKLLFTTYQSGEPLSQACQAAGLTFDFGIVDEAHRTAGHEASLFGKILDDANGIVIRKRLFMTATPRFFEGEKVTSMDDEAVYGPVFYRISTEQAIQAGILSDYKVLVLWVSSREMGQQITRKSKFLEVVAPKKYLALAVALEKAASLYGLKRMVTFHKSVALASLFGELVQEIRSDFKVFHVNHKSNIAKRQALLRQYQAADVSLITNARVLLEGFDMPEIDAVGFADAKKSHTEVIQAIGRCLRRHETKKLGYVILPIFIDDEGVINQEDFQNASTALTAMGANDSRVTSFFRGETTAPAGYAPEKTPMVVHVNTTPRTIPTEMLSRFRESIGIRVWNRLRLLNYKTYQEAKVYARHMASKYGIDGKVKWDDLAWGRLPDLRLPPEIPKRPDSTYSEEFEGWREFLGTAGLSYQEHQAIARANGLKTLREWYVFHAENHALIPGLRRVPEKIPGWISTFDFFGKPRPSIEAWPYQQAQEFAQKVLVPAGINQKDQWFAWVQGKLPGAPEKPALLPNTPSYTYGKQWQGWTTFFGTTKNNPLYRDFELARTFAADLAQNHGITTNKLWVAWASGQLPGTPARPADIPIQPREAYLNRWRSWGFFFGQVGRSPQPAR